MYKKIVMFYNKDPAGKNIAKILKDKNSNLEIIESSNDLLNLKDPGIKPELCVMASLHKSGSGIPALTTHSPGNFGIAENGGNDKELSIAPALYLHKMLGCLMHENEKRDTGYRVSFEATHHGPTDFQFPVVFAEVGSTEEQWNDPKACEAVADSIYNVLESEPEKIPVAIGFGGGHYCEKFSKIKDYAIGHICPKYNLQNLNHELLHQMIPKTVPKPGYALVEKKGMGTEKRRVLELLTETDLDIVNV